MHALCRTLLSSFFDCCDCLGICAPAACHCSLTVDVLNQDKYLMKHDLLPNLTWDPGRYSLWSRPRASTVVTPQTSTVVMPQLSLVGIISTQYAQQL
jgi:hypothetical protein